MSNPEFEPPEGQLGLSPERPETKVFDASSAFREAKLSAINHALQSKEGIKGLRHWQSLAKRGTAARVAKQTFETLGAYDRSVRAHPENTVSLQAELITQTEQAGEVPNRVHELLTCFRAKQLGQPMPSVRPEVERMFTRVVKSQSTEGEVDVPELMTSGNISYGSKFQWFESRLAGALDWLESRDAEEARRKAQEPPPAEIMKQKQEQPEVNVPPPQEDALTPSMEEMERSKENQPGAYFTVRPFYGGYYRGYDFDIWNVQAMLWEKSVSALTDVEETALDAKSKKTVVGTVHGGKKTVLPMPYGFTPDAQTVRTHSGDVLPVQSDCHGSFVIDAGKQDGLVSFSAEIGKSTVPFFEVSPAAPQAGTEVFSADTQLKLEEIAKSSQSALDKARALKAYVKKTLKYSNDSSFNAVYRSGDPNEYFSRIEQYQQADCDVANTYYVALLRRIGIPSRLVSGHYVKTKDKQNAAVMSSGTAHAWAEAWDGRSWQRLDATPPGDPSMDDQETDEKSPDDVGEGDFGEQEAQVVNDEQLEKMMADAERALEQKDRAPEELAALRFAEEAECAPEEAKLIMRKIFESREKRDNQGRNIRSRLLAEWQKVVQDNIVDRRRYTAPIRLSRGQDLVDPVETALDMKAGESDPGGFSKYERKVEREQIYGGFDAFLMVDKSGSMSETDPSSGHPKWEDQQTFVFLMMDSMYGAAQEFKRQRIKLASPMDLRVALVSFQGGSGKVELPLGTSWGPKEQARVWKSLQQNVGGGTPDHLGLQTIERMIQEDTKDHVQAKERLRLVLVSADGGSDSPAATIAAKESLKSTGVIVKAGGIGTGARQVVSTYTPDGTNLNSFADAPDWAASEVIGQAKKLFPKKMKKSP